MHASEVPPTAGDLVPGFHEAVAAVLTASRALVAVSARSLAHVDADVTVPGYRTLVLLARSGTLRIVDVAGALPVSPSTASRLCDRLVSKGLITREAEDLDRRAVRVALAAAGESLVREVTNARTLEIAAILARVPQPERDNVVRGFRVFSDAAGEPGDEVWDLDLR